MGSVFAQGLDADISAQFERCSIYNMEDCARCWAKYYCSGGCAAANFNTGGDIYSPYAVGCAMQKKRLEIAIEHRGSRKNGGSMIYEFNGITPDISAHMLRHNAVVIGDVRIGKDANLWPGAVVRGDMARYHHRQAHKRAGRQCAAHRLQHADDRR